MWVSSENSPVQLLAGRRIRIYTFSAVSERVSYKSFCDISGIPDRKYLCSQDNCTALPAPAFVVPYNFSSIHLFQQIKIIAPLAKAIITYCSDKARIHQNEL